MAKDDSASVKGVAESRPQRGRPHLTSARALESIALELFESQGFEETTVEQITDRAGVSARTFFRYFDTKASVLWHEFDDEVEALRQALSNIDPGTPMMDAIRHAVVGVNTYKAEDVAELYTRMHLIGAEPALRASAGPHYDDWVDAISEFAAQRIGKPADSLLPLAIGRSTLGACRAAFDRWVADADKDLTAYLDASLRALAAGYDEDLMRSAPD